MVGYHRNGFHLDGDEADDVGNGMALELAAGSRHVMLFLRGDAADTSPESGPRYDSGHADFGVRLFLLPPGMAVRPYADAAVTYADVSFFDPETDDIGRTLTGGGWSYAGGVVLGGANVGLDLSYRTTAVHFDEMEVDGETALLPEPFRGRTTRVVVGLRISRVYR